MAVYTSINALQANNVDEEGGRGMVLYLQDMIHIQLLANDLLVPGNGWKSVGAGGIGHVPVLNIP